MLATSTACANVTNACVGAEADEEIEYDDIDVELDGERPPSGSRSRQVLVEAQSAISDIVRSLPKVENPGITAGHFGLDGCCEAGAIADATGDFWPKIISHEPPLQKTMVGSAVSQEGEIYLGRHDDVVEEVTAPGSSGVAKDEKTRKRLDDMDMLRSGLAWLCWCVCCGVGFSEHNEAPLSLSTICGCCSSRCESIALYPDVCGFIQECCCCIALCRLPAQNGFRCICCNQACKEGRLPNRQAHGKGRGQLAHVDDHLFEPFVLCYCCCLGLRLVPPVGCVETQCKCGTCQYFGSAPILGRCQYLLNCWCLYSMCQCPPPAPLLNPVMACCGYQCVRKERWHK